MDIITSIIIALLCGLVPTLITLWLTEKVKGNVKNFFDEKLEVLKKEHSKELSLFQIELNQLKSKENFKFTKLHELRLEVLRLTYGYLSKDLLLLHSFVHPLKYSTTELTVEQNERKIKDEYVNSHYEFSKYLDSNIIYFDENIEELLKKYFNESRKVFSNYINKEFLQETEIVNSRMAYKEMEEIVLPIKKEIEKKFRELLGG